jgi:hypothetical protein
LITPSPDTPDRQPQESHCPFPDKRQTQHLVFDNIHLYTAFPHPFLVPLMIFIVHEKHEKHEKKQKPSKHLSMKDAKIFIRDVLL